jgi:hypothetical protein
MPRRSLKLRTEYIAEVKFALWRKGFPRQVDFAEDIYMSLSTVSKYLNGKSVAILNFIEISERLGFEDWKEIADWGELVEVEKC